MTLRVPVTATDCARRAPVTSSESFRGRDGDPAQRQSAKVKLIERECRRLGERQRNIEDVLQEHVLETETALEALAKAACVAV